MAKYARVKGEWREVGCTSCVHYVPCPKYDKCYFGEGLHDITDSRLENHVYGMLKSLSEEQECRKCGRTLEEAYHSWYCTGCERRLDFPGAPWTYVLEHYEPGGGEEDG